ncbi:hypothetical protein PspCFBP13508_21500 [Pseudomonas sp. CFBP13508]|nr:hypothetical protein DMX04_21415 [Pseudomonas koreensis]RRW56774.1 hypothetical protein EGJ55_08950 [Pseudomonas moraviensis]TKJ69685.1 hypothetical protein PspCFBP13508_21500 [Pseudomonas sp. CFBP13508]
MGASLLAKASRQPLNMATDPPLSRAGSLPQVVPGSALQRRLCCHAAANPLQQITAIPITVNPLGV